MFCFVLFLPREAFHTPSLEKEGRRVKKRIAIKPALTHSHSRPRLASRVSRFFPLRASQHTRQTHCETRLDEESHAYESRLGTGVEGNLRARGEGETKRAPVGHSPEPPLPSADSAARIPLLSSAAEMRTRSNSVAAAILAPGTRETKGGREGKTATDMGPNQSNARARQHSPLVHSRILLRVRNPSRC